MFVNLNRLKPNWTLVAYFGIGALVMACLVAIGIGVGMLAMRIGPVWSVVIGACVTFVAIGLREDIRHRADLQFCRDELRDVATAVDSCRDELRASQRNMWMMQELNERSDQHV